MLLMPYAVADTEGPQGFDEPNYQSLSPPPPPPPSNYSKFRFSFSFA